MCNTWETTPDFDVVSNGKRCLEKVKNAKTQQTEPRIYGFQPSQESTL
jgi:hypothetical protein